MIKQDSESYVLISGASSGIGREIAKQLVKHRKRFVLTARNEHQLIQLKSELHQLGASDVEIMPMDLASSKAVEILFQSFAEKEIHIDILINNAGIGISSEFKNSNIQKTSELIDLNINALVKMTHYFLNQLGEYKGYILNVASTAAFIPGPYMATYYASKSFVLQFSRALDYELKNQNCSLSVLCPGPVVTNFQKNAGIDVDKINSRKLFITSVEQVALVAIKGLLEKKFLIIPGFFNKISVLFSYLIPNRLSNKIIASIHG